MHNHHLHFDSLFRSKPGSAKYPTDCLPSPVPRVTGIFTGQVNQSASQQCQSTEGLARLVREMPEIVVVVVTTVVFVTA